MIRVRFTQNQFTGSEAMGFVTVNLELTRGTSANPFDVFVTPSEQTQVSAEGNNVTYICDRACKNRPCERKLHQVIFLLISFVLNALSHFHKLQKKAHEILQ